MSSPVLSRRSVARGAAWTLPALAASTAAPAIAASGPTVRNAGFVSTGYFTECSGTFIDVDGTADSQVASAGYTVRNTTSQTKISNVALTFYFPVSGLTFTAMDGSDPGWTNLTATGGSTTVSGVKYYAYSSTFKGTVTATAPSTTLNYGWNSNCVSTQLSSSTFIAASSASINGNTTTTNSGVASMTSD